jgi:hypothetical protein
VRENASHIPQNVRSEVITEDGDGHFKLKDCELSRLLNKQKSDEVDSLSCFADA